MDKYKRYYGIGLFVLTVALLVFGGYSLITPKFAEFDSVTQQVGEQEGILEKKQQDKVTVENRLKSLRNSIATSQKRIYAPVESNLGDDTLFFTLYNDVIEMIHSNSVKIKSIDYIYNPESDKFVESAHDSYFVCDVNMELVSNYVNLGKLIQDIYQYPYYIKINNLEVKPYEKDKKVLLSNLSLRLYAHSEPEGENSIVTIDTNSKQKENTEN